jgi:hypothetical protein
MKAYVIRVKYGGEVRSFGLCENMAVAELILMLSTVFDLEEGIVGLVTPVSSLWLVVLLFSRIF